MMDDESAEIELVRFDNRSVSMAAVLKASSLSRISIKRVRYLNG